MSKWPWILGGLAGGAILLFGGAALAAPPPRRRMPRGTMDEDKFGLALQRLTGFIQAARIDAKVYKYNLHEGMALGIQPGRAFVVEDSRALPRQVDGIDVLIRGWPR